MNNLLFAAILGAAMGYVYIKLQPEPVVVNNNVSNNYTENTKQNNSLYEGEDEI